MRCHVQFVCSKITALWLHIIEIIKVLILTFKDDTMGRHQGHNSLSERSMKTSWRNIQS